MDCNRKVRKYNFVNLFNLVKKALKVQPLFPISKCLYQSWRVNNLIAKVVFNEFEQTLISQNRCQHV